MPTGKPDPESEKQVLKRQADLLQSEMEAIRQRLDELDAEARTK
jgi:prefoldin subunit 5